MEDLIKAELALLNPKEVIEEGVQSVAAGTTKEDDQSSENEERNNQTMSM